MNGDPCFIELNGWKLAITSNDILIQMARAEKVRNLQSEKMKRVSVTGLLLEVSSFIGIYKL